MKLSKLLKEVTSNRRSELKEATQFTKPGKDGGPAKDGDIYYSEREGKAIGIRKGDSLYHLYVYDGTPKLGKVAGSDRRWENMGPASRGLLAQLALKGVGGLYSKDAALADARTMLQFVSDMTESVNEDKKLSSSEQRMINQINKAIKEKRPIATLGFMPTQFYMQNKDMFTESVNEDKKFSSSEQKMVNQIKRALKDKDPIYTLPTKTQDFYRKNKDMFAESMVNERLNVSRDLLTALYKDRGATAFAQMILELRDENALDDLVEALQNQYTI
jgi:L-fucose mutarotase/ribose pyranase (RbsD/FucU family)